MSIDHFPVIDKFKIDGILSVRDNFIKIRKFFLNMTFLCFIIKPVYCINKYLAYILACVPCGVILFDIMMLYYPQMG